MLRIFSTSVYILSKYFYLVMVMYCSQNMGLLDSYTRTSRLIVFMEYIEIKLYLC